jgi:hypothetical protein
MTISLDEHHASTLSDEELEAIRGEDLSEEERDLLQSVAGDGDDGDDDDEDDDEPADEDSDDDGDGATDDDQGGDADPATVAAAEAGSAAAQPTASARQSPASYEAAGLPADFQEQISATHDAQRDLLQKFQDGELEVSEYAAELSKITERRDALVAARIKAEISQEMAEQASAREWQQAVHRFIDRVAKDEQVDYRTDAARARDLDTFVRVLANDPENAQQSSEWFLQEAHKLVNARRGPVPAPAAGKENPPPRPEPRKPDLKAVPKTLAHVPGSDGPGDVSDEFGNVDALEGLDLESAIARMTPAQREKYARAG